MFEFDEEKIRKEQEENADYRARTATIGSIADRLSSQNSVGNFALGQLNQKSTAGAGLAKSLGDSIQDPTERRAKLYGLYKQSKEAKDMEREAQRRALYDDPNSDQTKALRMMAAKREIEGADKMTGSQIMDFIDPKKQHEAEANMKNQIELKRMENRGALEKYRAERDYQAGIKSQEEAKKKSEKMKSLAVPGYDIANDMIPDDTEAKKAKDTVATLSTLRNQIQRMKGYVKNKGSFEWGGGDGESMQTLATDLQTELKNLYELGALSGPDMGLMLKQVKDPASWDSLLTKDGTRQKQLDELLLSVEERAKNKLAAKGYVPAGSTSSPTEMLSQRTLLKGPKNFNPSDNAKATARPNFKSMSDEELKKYLGQ